MRLSCVILELEHLSSTLSTDMEKGADRQILSVEIFENCGNFRIEEDNCQAQPQLNFNFN